MKIVSNTEEPPEEMMLSDPMRYMKCSECKKHFMLRWNDDGMMRDGKWISYPNTLLIRGCPSGGIYDVLIRCPHCDFEQDL